MIVTYRAETVEFWENQGFVPELQFEADGYQYWKIDVPEDHAMLTSPEYLGLIIQEQKAYPEMIRARFKAPMFTVIVNRRVAMTPTDLEGEPMAMPIARDLPLLRSIFTKPEKKQIPKYMKLKRPNQIVNAAFEVRRFGVQHIAYYVSDSIVETFKIDTVIPILKPRIISMGADADGELARGDEEVPQVSSEEDVHPGSSG
jgi:hypothetical protein